jgi:hypothetical protein
MLLLSGAVDFASLHIIRIFSTPILNLIILNALIIDLITTAPYKYFHSILPTITLPVAPRRATPRDLKPCFFSQLILLPPCPVPYNPQ